MKNTILEFLENFISFDSRDWSQNKFDAILYGIFVGWESDEDDLLEDENIDDALNIVCDKFHLNKEELVSIRNKIKEIKGNE